METDLSGKVAVVTGASRGIGSHIAGAIYRAGAAVAITGRHQDTLNSAAAKIGDRCRPFVCDQRDPESVREMAQAVMGDLGTPDILVNNAGVGLFGNVVDMTLEQWNKVIETNLTGVFLTTRQFLEPMMRKGRGDIFMISSMSGKKGDPGASAYCASKFGLQGFSQSLMYEARQHNVRVMVLNPSSVEKGRDIGEKSGKGLHLHAADLAETIVHLARMPGRTMIRDMDIYGTNP